MAVRRRSARVWQACLLASLGLHAAVLLSRPVSVELRAGGAAAPAYPVMAVRQIEPSPMPSLLAAPVSDIQRIEAVGLQLPARAEPEAELQSSPALQGVAPSGDGDVYLPRRQLDQGPAPLSPVLLLWPADGPPAGHYEEVLSVFIDEAGVVQRVRLEGSSLPAALENVARQAFLATRFTPGQADGQPAKSWIRVEVTFERDPSAAPRGIEAR